MATLTAVLGAYATGAASAADVGVVIGEGLAAAAPAIAVSASVGGLGLGAAGMIGQGNAAAAQARSQQAIAEYNVKIQQREAAAQEQQALYRQKLQAQEANRMASSLRAGLGTSGAVLSEGTPLLIQATQAEQSELDNLMIGYQGRIARGQAINQAAIDRAQATIYGQQARSSATVGYTGAGTSLLTGFGKYGMKKAGY